MPILSHPPHGVRRLPPAERRVLFFGDSFVAGVGDPTGLGWVGRVVAAAFADGLPLTAYNLGVRGETSADVAERWRREAQPRILPDADCRVVFSFGTNDATVEDGRTRVDLRRSPCTLARLVEEAAALGLHALVVGPPPAGEPGQDERIRCLSARFAAVAAAHGVAFVSVVDRLAASPAWRAEASAGDGAHPGAAGYAALAELVLASGWLNCCAPSGDQSAVVKQLMS